MSKWHWPTWADWLDVYTTQPVINLSYKGYGNNHPYWLLLENYDKITKDDHVYVMWTSTHRQLQWYDKNWVEEYNCRGFFPKDDGKLWFTQNTPYTGLYRMHPEHNISFTQGVISNFENIYKTQTLLNSIGCKYTMGFAHNPWIDVRPSYKPTFTTKWNEINLSVSDDEIKNAIKILELKPVDKLLNLINWECFFDVPADIYNIKMYLGIYEYFISKKEYIMYKNVNDPHPCALAHHDFALEKILRLDPKKGQYRKVAKEISYDAINYPIPDFTPDDFVAEPNDILLEKKYQEILENLK